ncbi:hypothetical protein EVAR_20505_1 [Eumeta japonica]|uniref:Uncharacterized protein n=1 Tax=Eumeta variegata TaxID=151549 RepID=A0A4C1VJJ5_EUMVA|nr:hypothetical protein EVAR_20505_1 [Eumeta japonica]
MDGGGKPETCVCSRLYVWVILRLANYGERLGARTTCKQIAARLIYASGGRPLPPPPVAMTERDKSRYTEGSVNIGGSVDATVGFTSREAGKLRLISVEPAKAKRGEVILLTEEVCPELEPASPAGTGGWRRLVLLHPLTYARVSVLSCTVVRD